jgi:hypothetical protein
VRLPDRSYYQVGGAYSFRRDEAHVAVVAAAVRVVRLLRWGSIGHRSTRWTEFCRVVRHPRRRRARCRAAPLVATAHPCTIARAAIEAYCPLHHAAACPSRGPVHRSYRSTRTPPRTPFLCQQGFPCSGEQVRLRHGLHCLAAFAKRRSTCTCCRSRE